ncbi:MAG: hypothetical protein ACJ8C4_14385 [Gemmataceae bacterium]
MRSRKTWIRVAWLLVVAVVFVICFAGGPTNIFWLGKMVLMRIPADQTPVVYEGLPHQMYENSKYGDELATKTTFRIGKYPFYAAPIKLSDNDLAVTAQIVGTATSYEPNNGFTKTCGGFHPDYAIEWVSGSRKINVSLRFGCHEAIISDGNWFVKVDLTNQAYDQLMALLRPYRVNRPPSTEWLPGG